jgi:hypothetical protein
MTVWRKINGDLLSQGDLLRRILVPSVLPSFPAIDEEGRLPVEAVTADVIIVTQSCDLENKKLPFVLVAHAFTVSEFETRNEDYKKSGKWNNVARGRVAALHLIACPEKNDDSANHIVVDFRQLATLPFGYVQQVAKDAGERWRLQSPYLEAFSQAFGSLFSRVALPENIRM